MFRLSLISRYGGAERTQCTIDFFHVHCLTDLAGHFVSSVRSSFSGDGLFHICSGSQLFRFLLSPFLTLRSLAQAILLEIRKAKYFL